MTTGSRTNRRVWLFALCIAAVVSTDCAVKEPTRGTDNALDESEDVFYTTTQVRLRFRALVGPLSGAIIDAADRIGDATADRDVRRAALLWKIEAVPALREALFQSNPYVAVLDTWVLTWQMIDYFESGPGGQALGAEAPTAVDTCRYLETQIATVSAAMTYSGDVDRAREFARGWATQHPIRHSINSRESTVSRVTDREIQDTFSIPEVAASLVVTLDDLTRRLDIYSSQLLDQSRWQAELFAMDLVTEYELEKAMPLAESAVRSATDAVQTVNGLVPAVEEALAVAESAPELIGSERAALVEAAEQQIGRTLRFAREERVAALDHFTNEREVLTADLQRIVDAERQALTADAERIGINVVDHAMRRVERLVVGVLAATFVGALVLLFLTRRLFVARPAVPAI